MATTERERLTLLLFYGYVLALVFLAFQILRPFLTPLVWAGVLALCLWPLSRRLAARWGEGRGALATTLLAAILILGPSTWLVYSLVDQAGQVLPSVRKSLTQVGNMDTLNGIWMKVQAQIPVPPLEELRTRAAEWAGTLTAAVTAQAAGLIQNIAATVFKILLALLALFFFLRDGAYAVRHVRAMLPFDEQMKDRLINQTRDLVSAGVTATLVIALLQGLAGGVILACLGFKAYVFWGLCMVFCAVIPVVGTSLVWGPAAGVLFLEGAWVQGTVLVVLGVAVIGMIDNLLRPFLLRGKAPMNGLLTFLGILGGVAAFGLIGLVLGPVILAAALSLLATVQKEDERHGHDD